MQTLEEYEQVFYDLYNKSYFVDAPEILRYSDFERKMFGDGGYTDDEGKYIDTSLSPVVMPMKLIDIIKNSIDGFTIALHNSKDFDSLYRILTKYREYTRGNLEHEVNCSTRDVDEKKQIDEFTNMVIKLNKRRLPNIVFDFEKMNNDTGIVMPDFDKKIKIKKRAKRIYSW